MRLPDELRQAIDLQLQPMPKPAISRAATEISDAYRQGNFASLPLRTPAHRMAYLQVRMPATFAACRHVFAKLHEALPTFAPQSMLDLGAGPGTAAWAAAEQFPTLRKFSLIERDVELLGIGRLFTSGSSNPALHDADWTVADLRTLNPAAHDLLVISYAVGELNSAEALRLVSRAFAAAQVLVIVEPGTPKAFARVAELRRQLIADGATLAAPCPHERECPLYVRSDWCHFAERLERTAEHRRMKGGFLGYEDEKFSYLCATRLPVPPRLGRIVRHPQIHSGYVQLQVCAPEDLKQVTVTRSQKESYRAARKAEWGDRWID